MQLLLPIYLELLPPHVNNCQNFSNPPHFIDIINGRPHKQLSIVVYENIQRNYMGKYQVYL